MHEKINAYTTLSLSGLLGFASLGGLVGPVMQRPIQAEVYLNEKGVLEVLFPKVEMKKIKIELKQEEVHEIEKNSEVKVSNNRFYLYKNDKKGYHVYIDQVLGKHEYIIYAIGIKKDGKVSGIEILEYREAYGYEITRPEWRSLFVGKDKNSNMTLGKEISNISGATLSCSHVIKGVKRILQTHALLENRTRFLKQKDASSH